MKKILITGANGMIGSYLVQEFLNKYELILLAPRITRIEKYKGKVAIANNTLDQISKWEQYLKDVDCVIHLAAEVHSKPKTSEEEANFINTNVEGTKILYERCAAYGVKRFLFFSTNDVYMPTNTLITEDTPLKPSGIYGKSKLLAEKYLLEGLKTKKTAVCIFRPSSVYGENDKGSMKSLISLCKKGIVPMIGEGKNKKALVYLKDVAQAVEKYIESQNDYNGEVFNISSGDFEYKEIIDAISKKYQLSPIKLYIPLWFCNKIAPYLGPIKKLAIAAETKTVSNHKANMLLGYRGKFDIERGLIDSRNYYVETRT
jgi:nucleoside-diphosphate-sugar epimerase